VSSPTLECRAFREPECQRANGCYSRGQRAMSVADSSRISLHKTPLRHVHSYDRGEHSRSGQTAASGEVYDTIHVLERILSRLTLFQVAR